jgi:hypothetical protein
MDAINITPKFQTLDDLAQVFSVAHYRVVQEALYIVVHSDLQVLVLLEAGYICFRVFSALTSVTSDEAIVLVNQANCRSHMARFSLLDGNTILLDYDLPSDELTTDATVIRTFRKFEAAAGHLLRQIRSDAESVQNFGAEASREDLPRLSH